MRAGDWTSAEAAYIGDSVHENGDFACMHTLGKEDTLFCVPPITLLLLLENIMFLVQGFHQLY